MKRKIGFLLIVAAVLLLVAGIIKILGSRAPKEGELRVDATPTVSVFLDNKHIGRTPLREKVASGEYTVRLVAESGTSEIAPWQSKISVGPNLLTYINAALSDSELSSAVDVLWLEKSVVGKPELSVVTNPDGANILLDDSSHGITPITISDAEPGDHTLTVSSPGFVTRSMKVKLTQGYKLIASMKLALGTGGIPQPEASPSAGITGTPAATGSATQKPYAVIKETPVGFLRVRMEPTTSASEAGRVNPGETYHIFDEDSGWYQIAYDGKNRGWISGQYADKVE